MDELMRAIANLIGQYSGVVFVLSVVMFIVVLLLVVGIFCYVIKSMRDIDNELDDKRHFRNRGR